MIRSRQNAAMPSTASRPSPTEAFQLINYLTTINSYAQSAFNHNQQAVSVTSYNFCPGMKDVPQWLKSLRLHKYTEIFMGLTYEQMLGLNDQLLEKLGVTMGARGKILQSISKLRRRPIIIRDMITQLDASKDPDCRCPILYLRQFLSTPIRDYLPQDVESKDKVEGNCNVDQINDNNLPALLVILLQKVQHFFINCRQGEISEEYALMLFKSHDLILSNEAFTENQKRRVTHMKKQAKKYVCPGELKKKAPTPASGIPSGKCDFCATRDALVGPMPLQDVIPPSPVHRPKEKRKEAPAPVHHRTPEQKRSRSRAAELEIGEWNPAALAAATTSVVNMNSMAQYFNTCLQQLNNQPPTSDPYRQVVIQLAQNSYNPDLFALPIQPVSRPASQWNYSYAQKARYNEPAHSHPPPVNNLPPKQTADLPGISKIPQYRSSQMTPESPSTAMPPPRIERMERPKAPEVPWPPSLYNNDLEKVTATLPQRSKTDCETSLWQSLAGMKMDTVDGAHSSSGYSSSTSERGSGAGSPRVPQDISDPTGIRAWNTWENNLFTDIQVWSPARC